MIKIFFTLVLISNISLAQLPSQPIDPDHPGSASYPYTLKQENFLMNSRRIDVFLPLEASSSIQKAPVIIFGHGQSIDYQGYELTFQHLAKKGIAVIHPTFDSGFFDQDWRRMADDFNDQIQITINKYIDYIDPQSIVYAGHSKGAYVALMAAGAPKNKNQVGSILLFSPAGYDAEYLQNINRHIPVTIVWPDGDTIIKQSLISEIYTKLPSIHKQWIIVKSYNTLKADHFFPLNKSYFFGGNNGVSAYHFYATWKWLGGVATDLQSGGMLLNKYLYGDETSSTGFSHLSHIITKNW